MSESLRPTPRVLLAAFQGWGDAGEAATDTLQHLSVLLEAEVLHTIGASGYIDFQAHRPTLTRDAQGRRSLEWPETRLLGPIMRPAAAAAAAKAAAEAAPDPAGASTPKPAHDATSGDATPGTPTGDAGVRDVLDALRESAQPAASPDLPERVSRIDGSPVTEIYLLAGYEPAYNWQDFAEEIVDLVDTWAFDTVILIGSMYSEAPHSRQIATTITSDDLTLRDTAGAVASSYEGPAGIVSVIELALLAADVPTISLWAQVPHYVHSAPSPKATLALLDKLEEMLDVVIPRGELLAQSNEWETNINRIAEGDEEMTQYIRALERQRDDALAAGTTGDAIALEFEKFLKHDPQDPELSQSSELTQSSELPQDPELTQDPALTQEPEQTQGPEQPQSPELPPGAETEDPEQP